MTIRPATAADAPAIAQIHIATWRSAYRGLMPDEVLDTRDLTVFTTRWQQRLDEEAGMVFVAEVAGVGDQTALVGFAHGGVERTGEHPGYTGEVNSLYVLADQQGRGHGRGLVRAVAAELAPQHQGLLIWVLKGNPARGFYEALGGTYLAEKTFQISGHTMLEVAYGWPDLRTLL